MSLKMEMGMKSWEWEQEIGLSFSHSTTAVMPDAADHRIYDSIYMTRGTHV